MSNNNAIIAIVLILVLVIGGYFLFSHTAAAPTTEQAPVTTTTDTSATTSVTSTAAPAPAATSFTVTYTDKGFSPKTFNVSEGTAVHFVNNSTHAMWVAVGDHPTHTTYDGTSQGQHCSNNTNTNGSFDECAAVNPGTVYTYTFAKTGTFTFHNHVRASDGGTVTVTKQ